MIQCNVFGETAGFQSVSFPSIFSSMVHSMGQRTYHIEAIHTGDVGLQRTCQMGQRDNQRTCHKCGNSWALCAITVGAVTESLPKTHW